MPVDLKRVTHACNFNGSPYINNCDHDAAGVMFKHIIPNQDESPLVDRDLDWEKHGKLIEFDQSEFVKTSMDSTGYVFVPTSCSEGENNCKIHVALHGCAQGKSFVGDTYSKDSGYLEWSGVNNIITLFPQATKMGRTNPKGCWDWWGYSGANYAQISGDQQAGIVAMMNRLQEPAATQNKLMVGADLSSIFALLTSFYIFLFGK